jgi:N-succinyldiaminopimelate aminotransferase
MAREPYLASRLQGFGTTIFAEMSALATRTGAINLGQGFPDTDGPAAIAEAAIEAIRAGHNQYPPGPGIPALRQSIARHQRRFYGREHDPDRDVLVTAGAPEAIAEPFYDSYAACTAMAGAVRRVVTLRAPDYRLDPGELAAAVSPRTRLVLLNSPHNPTGKVFDRDELEAVAQVCIDHDLIAVTDEVYEHLVFDGREHIPLATLPGMAERTATVSSAGKTFSFTGWKVGWVCGPAPLVAAIRTAKQFLTYVNGAPFQPAIAMALDLDDDFYAGFAADLEAKRDRLCAGLGDAGFDVFRPAGTYFVTTDIRPFGEADGMQFCLSLPERCGVVAIPASVFYDDQDAGRSIVRFAFCKRLEVLDEAATRLKALAPA